MPLSLACLAPCSSCKESSSPCLLRQYVRALLVSCAALQRCCKPFITEHDSDLNLLVQHARQQLGWSVKLSHLQAAAGCQLSCSHAQHAYAYLVHAELCSAAFTHHVPPWAAGCCGLAQPAGHEITSFPGFQGQLPSRQYAGYINVPGTQLSGLIVLLLYTVCACHAGGAGQSRDWSECPPAECSEWHHAQAQRSSCTTSLLSP